MKAASIGLNVFMRLSHVWIIALLRAADTQQQQQQLGARLIQMIYSVHLEFD